MPISPAGSFTYTIDNNRFLHIGLASSKGETDKGRESQSLYFFKKDIDVAQPLYSLEDTAKISSIPEG